MDDRKLLAKTETRNGDLLSFAHHHPLKLGHGTGLEAGITPPVKRRGGICPHPSMQEKFHASRPALFWKA